MSIRRTLWTATLCCLLLLPAASAHAATLEVAFSADPAEDKPVTVTVSGTSDAARTLYVVRTQADSCEATATGTQQAHGSASYVSAATGTPVSGTFTKTYSFTPADAGTHRVCAYVAESADGAADATAAGAFAARMASATAGVGFSVDPVEDQPVAVTVSGTTEVARTLYVLRTRADSCQATADGTLQAHSSAAHLSAAAGSAVNGEYTKSFTVTPAEPGTYRVCAYVAQSAGGPSDATAAGAFTARTGNATASVAFSPNPAEDQPVTVTVSGSTEVPRTLFVVRTPADGCQASAAATQQAHAAAVYLSTAAGNPVSGAFTKNYAFTPADPGTHRICAYVAQSPDGPGDATAGNAFVLAGPAPGTTPPGGTAPPEGEDGAAFRRLVVTRRLLPGRRLRSPGTTSLRIEATPFSTVAFAAVRTAGACKGAGCRRTIRTTLPSSGRKTLKVKWSCKHPGRFKYAIVVTSRDGRKQVARGMWTVSANRCAALRRSEARRRAARR